MKLMKILLKWYRALLCKGSLDAFQEVKMLICLVIFYINWALSTIMMKLNGTRSLKTQCLLLFNSIEILRISYLDHWLYNKFARLPYFLMRLMFWIEILNSHNLLLKFCKKYLLNKLRSRNARLNKQLIYIMLWIRYQWAHLRNTKLRGNAWNTSISKFLT